MSSRFGPTQVLGETKWDDPREVAKAIKHVHDQRDLKEELEARTARNCAFLDGRQMYEWHEGRRQMVIPRKYKRVADFLIFNVIKPLIYQKLAKLSRSDPIWKVPAYTTDEFDQMVARFSNDLLGYYYQYGLRVGDKLEDIFRWMLASPVVFLEPTWDPMKGDQLQITLDDFYRDIPEDATEQMADTMRGDDLGAFRSLLGHGGEDGDDARPVVQYTGDIALHIRSIFNVTWYPFLLESWDQAHAYDIIEIMSPEEVAHRYRIPISEVMAQRNATDVHEHKDKLINGWTSPYMSMPVVSPDEDQGVLVHQFYADKVLAPPHGISAVLIGNSDEAIRVGPLANALKKLPLFPLVEHPSNGFAWGTCSIDDAICAQIELNDIRTQKGRWRRQRVSPRIIKDKTDGGKKTALDWTNTDAVYECNIDKAPQILQMPSEEFNGEKDSAFALRYLHDAMAVPDVALGRTTETDAQSGKAVLALQEEANERLRTIGKRLNHAMALVGEFFLAELQEKAIAQRITPIAGDNGAMEFKAWSRADLRPTLYAKNPSNVAVVTVDTFTNIPTTNAERRQMVLALYDMKVLRPGEHDRLLLQALGLGEDLNILDQGRSGRDKAENKVMDWRDGKNAPPVQQSDDHEAAIPIISAFINSGDFTMLAAQRPDIAQEALQHLDAHEQGQYDVKAFEVMRAQFAQMRAAALFSRKATESGLPGAAMFFAIQANGGINPDAVAPNDPDKDKNDRGDGAAEENERDDRPSRRRRDERAAVGT